MKKRFAFILALVLCAALLCVGALAAEGETATSVIVCPVGTDYEVLNKTNTYLDLTQDGRDNTSGKISFDASTGTLTLDNVNIKTLPSGFDNIFVYNSNGDLTINLVGENVISRASGISPGDYSLKITGDGSLDITVSDNSAIAVEGSTLEIDGCTINAKVTGTSDYYFHAIDAYKNYSGEIVISNGANVTASSLKGCGIRAYDMEISGGSIVNAASGEENGVSYNCNAVYAINELIVTGAELNATAYSSEGYPSIYASSLEIGEGSKVTSFCTGGYAIYAQELNISASEVDANVVSEFEGQAAIFCGYYDAEGCEGTISDGSTVTAETTSPYGDAIHSDSRLTIQDSKIIAKSKDKDGYAMFASGYDSDIGEDGPLMTISGNVDITCHGGIDVGGGDMGVVHTIAIVPSEGALLEVKTGDRSEETATKHFGASPFDKETELDPDLDGTDYSLRGDSYIRIKPHTHSGGTATCTAQAICSDCGRAYGDMDPDTHSGEIVWTITDSTHSGVYDCCGAEIAEARHEYKGGVCVACGAREPYQPETHEITVEQPANGSVSTSLTNSSAGAKITVTATPNAGYELAYITVDGKPIEGNSFTMPDHGVTVSAVFTDGFPFADVPAGSWYREYVEYVYANGLMDGTSAAAFEPDAGMTRAMVWAILARMDGETVTGTAWQAQAKAWAVANGVSDGTDPNGLVTREQFAAMLWRYAGEPATAANLDGYTDGAGVSAWAVDAMAWAVEKGIITGVTDTTLAPRGTATRAQCAAMLMRFDTM